MRPAVFHGDVLARLADDGDQLPFVVDKLAAQDDVRVGTGDAGRKLGEHQRHLGNGHVGLFRVIAVV